jgi:outer membrane cobalamin receptor
VRATKHLWLLLAAAAAQAQEPAANPQAAPAPSPPPGPIAEVVVQGERAPVETTIDRKIYSVARDLQSTSGSVADVLRNLPSVTVDADGNPSLRGDSSVTILIDGRLAPEYNNANRGAALQQLGAANIDRIEVLTNPPANFKRDGAGGIINIITKRKSGAKSASAQASLGSLGRYNLGGRGGAQVGKWNLRGSASARWDDGIRDIDNERRVFDDAGALLDDRRTHTGGKDERFATLASLGVDYDLTEKDRLTAEGRFNRRQVDSFIRETATMLDENGSPTGSYSRTGRGEPRTDEKSAQLRYHRNGANNGDGFTASAERSTAMESATMRYLKTPVSPSQPDTTQFQRYLVDQVRDEFKLDYIATQESKRKVIAGYELTREDNLFDNAQTLTVEVGDPELPDPNFTNVFRYDQTLHALYGTYEVPFGKWKTLTGVRLEAMQIDLYQVTTDQRSDQDYFRVYPSLHVSRELNEQQTLTFSYSRRVFRPRGVDFNPFREQINEFMVREGNPDLEPSEFDSLEAGWSHEQGRTTRGLTLYARHSGNARTTVTSLLSPTVTLQRPENMGRSLSGGLEFSATGQFSSQLDYNLSGNAFYNEIDAHNLGFTRDQSTFSVDAKAALTWRLSEKDTLQLNVGMVGRRVTPQGYRPRNASMDLGYRHQFRSNLSITATVTDVFGSRRFNTVVDTPELFDSTRFRFPERIVQVGVSWSMAGAKKPAQEKFEYE